MNDVVNGLTQRGVTQSLENSYYFLKRLHNVMKSILSGKTPHRVNDKHIIPVLLGFMTRYFHCDTQSLTQGDSSKPRISHHVYIDRDETYMDVRTYYYC